MKISEIVAHVAFEFDLTPKDITGPRKDKRANEARFAAMHIARKHGNSLPKIGFHMNRDHTSVKNGVDRLAKMRTEDSVLNNTVFDLEIQLARTPVFFRQNRIEFKSVRTAA